MTSWQLQDLLPGLYVGAWITLLAAALRRWYDPVPRRLWAVLALVLLVLLGPVLLAGYRLLPLGELLQYPPYQRLAPSWPSSNSLQHDLLRVLYPTQVQAQQALRAGRWPLWNPRVGLGMPLLADPQAQVAQPLVLVALQFPATVAPGITAALRITLALTFCFLFLRRQGIAEGAALAAALAYGLSGFVLLWLGWPLASSAALLPVMLYALARFDGPRQNGAAPRDLLLLLVAVTTLLLGGHPESELHVLALAAAYALHRAGLPRTRRSWRPLAQAGMVLILAAALAAPVLLPAACYLPQSLRAVRLEERRQPPVADRVAAEASRDPLRRLLPVAAPNAFGNNRFGAFWGEQNVNESAAGFAGSATLLAALLAALPLGAGGQRLPQERLMLGVAALCLVLVARPPGLPRLLLALPVLQASATFHHRVLLLLAFAQAYLAACTWHRWQLPATTRATRQRILWLAASLAGLLAWGYLVAGAPPQAGMLSGLRWGTLALQVSMLAIAAGLLLGPGRPHRAGVLVVVVAAELLLLHGPANPPQARRLEPTAPCSLGLLDSRSESARLIGLDDVLPANLASALNLADARCSSPIKPYAYWQLVRPLETAARRPSTRFHLPDHPLYDLLAVRYVLAPPGAALAGPLRLVASCEELTVWERPHPLPRLFLPLAAQAAGASTSWLQWMSQRTDFATEALVEGDGPARWQAQRPAESYLRFGPLLPERISAQAFLAEPRLLAISSYQDGGWRLLVAGRSWPTVRLDGALMGAWLPAGRQQLELLYRPPGLLPGVALAALALTLAAASLLPLPPRRRG